MRPNRDLTDLLDEEAWDVPDRLTEHELYTHGGALMSPAARAGRDETEEF